VDAASAVIRAQEPQDRAALDALHEQAFGPGRFARSAYRIREQVEATRGFINLCACLGPELVGAVDLTPITVGGRGGALLLGPLVIADAYKNKGIGLRLMQESAAQAVTDGNAVILLVGDLPYYARGGYQCVPRGQIEFPAPVDLGRLLYLELKPGVIGAYSGLVCGAR
jgi:predicted N-acetyltransferase YhbS